MNILIKIVKKPINWFVGLTRRKKMVVLTLLFLFLFWRYQAWKNSGIPVTTSEVEMSNIVESISASGSIQAANAVDLFFPYTGKVAQIPVNEGYYVKKGDLIARLDTTSLFVDYQNSQSSLRGTEASLDYVYDQVQGHDNDESFAQKATRTEAEVTKDIAYRNTIKASWNLANASISAPFNGIITQISDGVAEGAVVTPASATFSLVDPNSIYLEVEVNEEDVVRLSKGQKALITLDAFPEKEIESEVSTINFSSIRTATGGKAYKVSLGITQDSDNSIRLGMEGDAEFVLTEKDNVIVVPITALTEEDDKEYVWVVDSGKAFRKEVVSGVSSTNSVEIVEGIDEGEIVIERPPAEITEGARVKINI